MRRGLEQPVHLPQVIVGNDRRLDRWRAGRSVIRFHALERDQRIDARGVERLEVWTTDDEFLGDGPIVVLPFEIVSRGQLHECGRRRSTAAKLLDEQGRISENNEPLERRRTVVERRPDTPFPALESAWREREHVIAVSAADTYEQKTCGEHSRTALSSRRLPKPFEEDRNVAFS